MSLGDSAGVVLVGLCRPTYSVSQKSNLPKTFRGIISPGETV